MSSLCASSVKSVPIARSTVLSLALVLVQLDARGDQPDRRGGRPAVGPESDLALAGQPVVRVERVVLGRRLGESEVTQLAGHLGGLTALRRWR